MREYSMVVSACDQSLIFQGAGLKSSNIGGFENRVFKFHQVFDPDHQAERNAAEICVQEAAPEHAFGNRPCIHLGGSLSLAPG